jgi:hypothetical protein
MCSRPNAMRSQSYRLLLARAHRRDDSCKDVVPSRRPSDIKTFIAQND